MSHALSSQEAGSDSSDPQQDTGITQQRSISLVSLLFISAALVWSLPATYPAFGLAVQGDMMATSHQIEEAVAQELSASLIEEAPPRVYPSYKMLKKQVGGSAGLPVVRTGHRHHDAIQVYITKKYRISSDQARKLVSTAHTVGNEMELDPLLLLAIMAIESSFNPQAQSRVGAQGLMQVMTKIHHERFKPFGGPQAAFNPVANIRVGASILKDYVVRSGSLHKGLKMYVGVGPNGKSVYGDRVLAERQRMAKAAGLTPEQSRPPVLEADNTRRGQDAPVVLNQPRVLSQVTM